LVGLARRVAPVALLALAANLAPAEARADEGEELTRLNLSHEVASTPAPPLGGTYLHTFGELSLGKGLHTNNPYRLGTSDAVGFTATYLDLSLGVAFGPPDGFQQGAQVSFLTATDGIAQQVLGLYYAALYPLGEHALVRGHAGIPFVLGPDPTLGLEAGAGGVWLFTGGIGASAELVGSLFYGAATPDRAKTAIPVFALQVGAWFDYEVLP
jgi:hypothetical protein